MPGVRRRSMRFAIAGAVWAAGLWAGGGTGNVVQIPAHPPLGHTPHSAAQIASRDVAVTASLAVARAKKEMEDWMAYEADRRGNIEAWKFARSFSVARGYAGAMWISGTKQPLVVGRGPDSGTLAEIRSGVGSGEGWYVGAAREDGQGRLYCPVGLKRPSGFLAVCVSLE
ncbi:MAG: hypothetical protein IRY98_05555, partial [Alicyclobacillaceae bacterium]|nr:hypothetical protein [Alicyclobacillaceae bacterium]